MDARWATAGSDAVMLEGVVERKSWLHDALSDTMILVWHGGNSAAARTAALADLARLERELAEYDERLPDDGSVLLAFACARIDDGPGSFADEERLRLRELIGRVLATPTEWPLTRRGAISAGTDASSGGA